MEVDEPCVGHLEAFPEANCVEIRELSAEPCRHDGSVRNHHCVVAEFGDRGIEPGRSIVQRLPTGHRSTRQVSVYRVHELVLVVVPGSVDLTEALIGTDNAEAESDGGLDGLGFGAADNS